MGGIVSAGGSHGNLEEHGDWFIKQGYKLKMDIRCNPDALADHKVYNNGRFSCTLPTICPVTTQRNNDIYEHVTRLKLQSPLRSSQARMIGSSNYTGDPRTLGTSSLKASQ